jgi:hypothetical protein
MSDLGVTYSNLGRHSEALAMRESVLEFRRRVLPADHPDIGEGREWGVLLRFFHNSEVCCVYFCCSLMHLCFIRPCSVQHKFQL